VVPVAFYNIIVPAATEFTWNLHLSWGTEKPRSIVVAFQTGRGGDQTTNNASFDFAGLNVIDAYVDLDGDRYPFSNVATNYVSINMLGGIMSIRTFTINIITIIKAKRVFRI